MIDRWLRDARRRRWFEQAREGDERAFVRLYAELYPVVVAFVGRRLRATHEVEEVVSSTFHAFVERLDAFDAHRGTVTTWILVLARSHLVDHIRARRTTVDVHDLADVLADAEIGPEGRLVEEERRRRVGALVRALPEDTRELLVLRYGDGLTHRAIAAVVKADERSVRQRISRAVRELRASASDRNDPTTEIKPCAS
jgi:RNA polymerase sigma-70 factor, ECF subfamily